MNKLFLILLLITLSSCRTAVNQTEVRVDLRGKHLKAIPKSVLDNKNIEYLDLGSSNVTFYPPLTVQKDPNSNNLTALPERIGELSNLRTLILNTNNLKSLPISITKLEKLEVLDPSINHELVIADELEKLKKLPSLKTLKIIDVKMDRDAYNQVKKALGPDIRIIVSIEEYFESMK